MMSKVKSELDYVLEITDLHEKILQAEDDFTKAMHEKTLNNRLTSWIKKLDIVVYRANQENEDEDSLAWTGDDIGFTIEPMPTKKATGYDQVGDYMTVVKGYKIGLSGSYKYEYTLPVIVERKGGKNSVADLYGTLTSKANYERFKREVYRAKQDDRFDQMVVICEGSNQKYMQFVPPYIGKKRNTGKKNFGS